MTTHNCLTDKQQTSNGISECDKDYCIQIFTLGYQCILMDNTNNNAGKTGSDACQSTGYCLAKNVAGAIQCSRLWQKDVCLKGGKCVIYSVANKVGQNATTDCVAQNDTTAVICMTMWCLTPTQGCQPMNYLNESRIGKKLNTTECLPVATGPVSQCADFHCIDTSLSP